ncbi:DUF1772 domain-containing protein [Sporosarcina sp. P20a]|uniref:anthrone oxygenase family protein n=1 Tax=Sporosarcina sp. P20a TaxID=2048256 RepID=UPI001E4C9BD5|nr:anthrone oxygenase family protein [Sporosarcina sp. P20a]
MNGLFTGFRAVLVIFCVLLLPSIAFASDHVPHSEMYDHQLQQYSFSQPTALKSTELSEGLMAEQIEPIEDTKSLLFTVLACLAVLTTGMMAGIVFAYANSVMPGLRKADDRTFVLASRHLTSSVANPLFLIISNSALIVQIGFIVVAVLAQQFDQVVLGSIALIFYIATLLITFLGNLPLNKAIISAELPASDAKWNKLRVRFESSWTRLNNLRTITCILSVSTLIIALNIT